MTALPPDSPEQSDIAACRTTRRYIDDNIPPPDFVRLAAERENWGKHIALRVLFGMPAMAAPDPLYDLAAARSVIAILRQESTVAHADRLDRALDWAARSSTAVEAGVLVAHAIIHADIEAMPDWRARGHRDLRQRPSYKTFMRVRGAYLPQEGIAS